MNFYSHIVYIYWKIWTYLHTLCMYDWMRMHGFYIIHLLAVACSCIKFCSYSVEEKKQKKKKMWVKNCQVNLKFKCCLVYTFYTWLIYFIYFHQASHHLFPTHISFIILSIEKFKLQKIKRIEKKRCKTETRSAIQVQCFFFLFFF